jgi:nitrogen fixation/metabolism regulation signal transduction histidine kinase
VTPAPRVALATRIFLAFLAVLVAFGVVSVASVRQHEETARTLRLLHEGYLPLAIELGSLRATESVFEVSVDSLDDPTDRTGTLEWLATARRVRRSPMRRTRSLLERAEALAPGDDVRILAGVRTSLDDMEQLWRIDEGLFQGLSRAVTRGEDGQVVQLVGQLRHDESVVNASLRDALRAVQERIASTSAEAAQNEAQSMQQIALLTVLALAAGFVISLWARGLIVPLTRLRERVVAVARGDLSRQFEGKRDDEIGQLATEFERMVGAVAARDQQLRDAASALSALQQMQQQIVASLRAAVVVVDGSGAVRTSNEAASTILGIGADDEGRSLDALGLAARLPGVADAIDRVALGEERAVLVAAPLAPREGRHDARSVDVVVTPFGAADVEGPRRSVLVVVDDVTDELRTKERLIQTERLAAMGRMAAHVTHEVRNPLSSIGLNAEMLEEELASVGSAETKTLLRAIQREVDRLTSITEEYLRIARLPAPRLEPEDPAALVRELAHFVAREMESTNVRLELEVEEGLPLVPIDEAQIRQSLLNLLRNAREAMPTGGRIVLGAHREDGGVALSVRDEGEGIPDERKERVFDVFFSTKERGTGLGLPLTREIVVAHRGRVRCEDAGGGRPGTVFTLWLPALVEPPAEAGDAIGP